MAITAEQEKQKITFPEIKDGYTDEIDDFSDRGAAVAEAPVQETPDAKADDGFTIDVDIDNMVWEIESASDGETSEYAEAESEETEQYDPYEQEYYDEDRIRYSRRMNKHLFTWLFSVGLGMYGVDRFVRGQVALGVFKILTFGGFGIWYLADAAIAIYKSYASENSADEDLYFDEYGRYIF